jgi:methylmalonyl-CoA epimerase
VNSYPIDHIGIAVNSLNNSIKYYQDTFGFKVEDRETLDSSGVELAFLKTGNVDIELIAPLQGNTTLSNFLKSRGEGLHHICYKVDNLELELERFRKINAKLIDEKPRKGARGARIAFIHPESMNGILTELCDYPNS